MNNGLYKNKYRIKSTRLPGRDYSLSGKYFVTVCTKDAELWFGDVVDGKMVLNEIGRIVDEELRKTPEIRESVRIDPQIVMPNHWHAIFIILDMDPWSRVETPRRGVSTSAVHNPNHNPEWKPNSLGSIVNQIKGVCTKRILKLGYKDFAWQERFYDHIIRNDKSLEKIQAYILDNPWNWEQDRNNPVNLWM